MHLRPRLNVVLVKNGPMKIFVNYAQGVFGPHVGDGITALVRGAVHRVRRTRRTFRVVNGGVRFQRVTEDVKTARANAVRCLREREREVDGGMRERELRLIAGAAGCRRRELASKSDEADMVKDSERESCCCWSSFVLAV